MKRKLILVTAIFAAVIILISALFSLADKAANPDDARAEQLIALNEIAQLAETDAQLAAQRIEALEEKIRSEEIRRSGAGREWIFCGVSLVFLAGVMGYVYVSVLRPFDKMKEYAAEIAKGNFDVSLDYARSNYFGQFTWAFDSMRREITKARACEREAVENNKTIIATLSHDIKTPIASIRAYAEGLEAHMDSSPERRERYLSVIMRKCDEVAKLTNDLFLHALSDLDKLKINTEPLEISSFVQEAIEELAAQQDDIFFIPPSFSAYVNADRNRLLQIIENLVNNARKYAKSRIDVSLSRENGTVCLKIRDYGGGIPDEDMPFIFDKFYRGKNCGSEQGTGLGLYIVKYLAEKMGGSILLHNHTSGLEALVSLPMEK